MIELDMIGATFLGVDVPSLDDVRAGRGVIKKGMKGDPVVYVQALVGVVADGDFGSNTEAVVKKFQTANKLTADGVVGRGTMAALDKLAGGTAGISPQKQTFSANDVIAAEKPATRAIEIVKSNIPGAVAAAPSKSNKTTYIAVGASLGVAALGGIAYAVWGR